MTKYWREDAQQQNFEIIYKNKTYVRICEFDRENRKRNYWLEIHEKEYFPGEIRGMWMNGMFENVQRQFIKTAFETMWSEPFDE